MPRLVTDGISICDDPQGQKLLKLKAQMAWGEEGKKLADSEDYHAIDRRWRLEREGQAQGEQHGSGSLLGRLFRRKG